MWAHYLSPADTYRGPTHRLSQEHKGLDGRVLRASQRPSMPIVCMHGVCSRYLLRHSFSPPVLTGPLAAAPSSPSLCHWSARAAPEANISLRTVKSETYCIGVGYPVHACGVVCVFLAIFILLDTC